MDPAERTLSMLGRLELLAGSSPERLVELARMLREVEVADGETMMGRGDPGGWFAVITDGEAVITQDDGSGDRRLGTAGPGSVLGEIALLTGARRSATVKATQSLTALVGGARAFGVLLEDAAIEKRMRRTAAQRLATYARAVQTTLADGTELEIRPGLPSDRGLLIRGLQEMSEESRRRRFFSAGPVPARVVDYLLDVDYVDHFTWIATEPGGGDGVGSARYIRTSDDPHTAEIAFGVVDHYQRRGIGTLLVGALAHAAPYGDISHFRANVLRDNPPVGRMLEKAGAVWTRDEPGVLSATVEVASVGSLLEPALADELRHSAKEVISAARLALA